MATSNENSGALRNAATQLADAFRAPDIAALLQMTEAEREEQEQIRRKLGFYLDRRFDESDPRRGGPGGRAAEVAGGLRDIAMLLWQDAQNAQSQAGDLDS